MNILLIESNKAFSELLIRGLAAKGYEVELVRDGQAGLARAQVENWDAIILDLMLPNMDGRELCQIYRAAGYKTPILMLTAIDLSRDIVRGLRMGADDYLEKPFDLDELAARLELLIGRDDSETPPAGDHLRIGEIHFDRNALQVIVADQQLNLTSLEYALLEFLMVEAGKVVSRPRILRNVWGAHEDPLTNVVDVYIGRLRKAIMACGVDDPITTVRGRGYRFEL